MIKEGGCSNFEMRSEAGFFTLRLCPHNWASPSWGWTVTEECVLNSMDVTSASFFVLEGHQI